MPFDFTVPESVDFDIAFEDTKVDDKKYVINGDTGDYIGIVGNGFTCGAVPRQVFVGYEGWRLTHAFHPFSRFDLLQHLHDVLVVAGSNDRFCLWDRLQELVLKMLCQASSDY